MASHSPPAVNIDVYSDIACPWCYVGKRRLDLAIQKIEADARSPPIRVVVKWLILLADNFGKGAEAKQLLLEKTYEEGLNVSNVEALSSVAEDLGLPKATEYLKSDQGKKEVLDQDKFAKSRLGIGSVPHFILYNKFFLSGAQDVATFESAIQKAASLHLQ